MVLPEIPDITHDVVDVENLTESFDVFLHLLSVGIACGYVAKLIVDNHTGFFVGGYENPVGTPVFLTRIKHVALIEHAPTRGEPVADLFTRYSLP